jgi:uncharacterized protein (DUF488 family)
MYYRRKLLLALLEVFGGNLGNTDCEKLLFNFCQMTGKNYYDFFPYQYGPFSFVSYYDKRRLTEMGLIKDADDFQLAITSNTYLTDLEPADKVALSHLKLSGIRGQNLVRKVYREYPQFAARSKIISDLFNEEEIKQIQFSWNVDTSPVIFTVGYEGLTIDSFLNKLIARNIMAVIDVRNNPQSMKFGFSKRRFSEYIEKAGLKYMHIPELGIPSALRKGLGSSVSHETLFRKYETELLPKQTVAKKRLLDLIEKTPRIALVCFESDHHFCHRNTLVENLKKENPFIKPILHI